MSVFDLEVFGLGVIGLEVFASKTFGGRGEIRTRDKVNPVPPFQGGDLNRSSTLPYRL